MEDIIKVMVALTVKFKLNEAVCPVNPSWLAAKFIIFIVEILEESNAVGIELVNVWWALCTFKRNDLFNLLGFCIQEGLDLYVRNKFKNGKDVLCPFPAQVRFVILGYGKADILGFCLFPIVP